MGKRQRFPHLIVQLKRPSTTKLHNTTQDASAMSTKGIADVFFGSCFSVQDKKSLLPFKIAYGGYSPPGPSVFSGIDYLGYTCPPIALLC